jgi:predicted HTH transcriptional regulator
MTSLVDNYLGAETANNINFDFQNLDDKKICVIKVTPSDVPIYVKNGAQEEFFIRLGNTTRNLSIREAIAFIKTRFK